MTDSQERMSSAINVNILWDRILMVSVIGLLDSDRTERLMDGMLAKVEEVEAEFVILDILGVTTVDSAVANHLIKIAQACRLMGCECIISGIQPEIAQSMAGQGLDLGAITTQATLRKSLELAFERLGLAVRPTTTSAVRAT